MENNYFDNDPTDFNDFLSEGAPHDNSPEAIAFLSQEEDADWEFYGITLH
jgi:hypothetical protein